MIHVAREPFTDAGRLWLAGIRINLVKFETAELKSESMVLRNVRQRGFGGPPGIRVLARLQNSPTLFLSLSRQGDCVLKSVER